MILPWMALKGRQLPGYRYWDRICITREAYLRQKTKGFRVRHEPCLSLPSCRVISRQPVRVSNNENLCSIGKPTKGYGCRTRVTLHQPISNQAGFHTVRGGIDPRDHRFHPRLDGVKDVWKDFSSRDGTLSPPCGVGCMKPRLRFPHPAGRYRPRRSPISSSI